MAQQISTNTFGCAKWIVSKDATQGTHTSIAAALTSASSGDTIFIRPETYSENLTLKAGVNLVAFVGDDLTPTVSIVGKMTATFTGTCTISNIYLQTNSDFILVNSGSNATTVNLVNCTLDCLNNTGISFTNSNSSANIFLNKCYGNLRTTGIALWTSTSTGQIFAFYTQIANPGLSTTATSNSAGAAGIRWSRFDFPLSTSSTGVIQVQNSVVYCQDINTTAITHNGTGNGASVSNSAISSGTAAAISIGSGATLEVSSSTVTSSNGTAVITGAGTLINVGIACSSTGFKINTSATTARNLNTGGITFDGGTTVLSTFTQGTWTPTMVGSSTAGVTTYASQGGRWQRVGRLVTCQGNVAWSGATGTGNCTFGGYPATPSASNQPACFSLFLNNAATTTIPQAFAMMALNSSATTNTLQAVNTTGTSSNKAISATGDVWFSFTYEV